MPAAGRSSPPMLACRPAAISRWLPSIVSGPPGPSTASLMSDPVPTWSTLVCGRLSTPSRASASRTTAAHSGSSLASGLAASITIASAPSRRNPCASSSPIGPPPITTRRRGHSARSKMVSLVKYGTRSSPGIGGTAGEDPVASTKRRALISNSPTATVRLSLKRAAPTMTRTPSPLKRSTESLGAIAAMTRCTCSCTLPKSTCGRCAAMPNGAPRRNAFAFAGSRDHSRTGPEKTRLLDSVRRGKEQALGFASGIGGVARPPASQENWEQRNQSQRHQRGQKLRRERGRHIEMQVAVGRSGGEAVPKRRTLGADHAVEPFTDQRIGEGSGNDPERGRADERGKAHADERGSQVDQPERKNRDQAKEQQIAEGVGAQSIGDVLRAGSGATHQGFAARGARDAKDDGSARGSPHDGGKAARQPSEQDAAANGEYGRARDRQGRDRNVERHERGDGGRIMVGHERIDTGTVPNQRLERQLPMPTHRQDHGHRHHDCGKRQETTQPKRPGNSRAGAGDRSMSFLVRHRQRQSERC